MREFSRRQSSEFVAFKEFSRKELEKTPTLRRLDCLNPVKAINHKFDFSYVPEIDLTEAWKQFLTVRFDWCAFSLGVRDSLFDIFSQLKQRETAVDIPSDVYPVYLSIAEQTGVLYRTFPMFPSFDVSSFKSNTVLITAPVVPSGRDLTPEEVSRLMEWLAESPDRLLIIDRVYDYNNSNVIQTLLDSGQTIVCYSLSKLFLSPLVMGMAIVPESMLPHLQKPLPPESDKAKVLLTKYKEFPRQQQEIFRYRWDHLDVADKIEAPELGYLSVVPTHHKELLKENILAIPGDVYGISNDYSILSCLHEDNSFQGSEHVQRYHVTVLSNFAKGFDKYSRKYGKANIPESTFPDQFFLLDSNLEAGFKKAKRLKQKTGNDDKVIVLQTTVQNCELIPNRRTNIGWYVNRNWINIDKVFDAELNEMSIEDAYAESLALNSLLPWSEVQPRSLSILPISSACQAHCDFCFSHSSVSEEQKQGKIDLTILNKACSVSLSKGAERFVITGGGEPTLLSHEKLLEIMRVAKKHFQKIVMITNGYQLGHATEAERRKRLLDYEAAGLSVLALSRHSHNENNSEIMGIETHSELVAETWRSSQVGFQLRWVCVLQRKGVHDEATLSSYCDWVVSTGARQICFKELYVATTRESVYAGSEYNLWCSQNQVPMSIVLDFLIQRQATKVAELPWGAPVYRLKWKGHTLDVAVYTEPSVFWERSNGICRSWNLMADGTCFANLETTESQVILQ